MSAPDTTDIAAELRRLVANSDAFPWETMEKAAAEIELLRGLLDAILAADERGQGLPYAEAMKAAHDHLESVRGQS